MYIYYSGSVPKTTENDIIVYKLFKKKPFKFFGVTIGVISPFMLKKYIFGKKYKTKPITVPALGETVFDQIEMETYLKSNTPIYYTRAVRGGFHCATNKDRLLNSNCYDENCSIFKCIIPKGSLVYNGIDEELIVSNQIIVTKDKCF